jgi:hypothetical protein
VLAVFWAALLLGLRDKGVAYDEITHATSGFTYWKFNDYRIDPSNGNLPKRIAGLPLAWSDYRFPSRESEPWRNGDEWGVADEWFHDMGNDVGEMLRRGRAAMGIVAVVLGGVIWWASRRLFGPVGGMLSLLLYVLNPAFLANGALITSDTTTALFFLAATLGIAATIERVTIARVLGSSLLVSGLFLSKVSAVMIVPIALVLVVARLLRKEPLPVKLHGEQFVSGRGRQALVFAVAASVHAVLAVAVVWMFYGFRYSAFADADGRFPYTWQYLVGTPAPEKLLEQLPLTAPQKDRARDILASATPIAHRWPHEAVTALKEIERTVLERGQARQLEAAIAAPPSMAARLLGFARDHRLLPEAFIVDFAHGWHNARRRVAFLNGDVSLEGWPSFFPYAFLVKTPLIVFAMIALAVAAMVFRPELRRRGREVLPLLVLLAVYGAVAIGSHIDLGHRLILPVYPPLFVFCGAAAAWVFRARFAPLVLGVLLLAQGMETAWRFPNYLAYFNGLVTPREAYRHLVDSSLDWGQELPAIRRYLDEAKPVRPVYLSYFGTGRPAYYSIDAIPLCPDPGLAPDVPPLRVLPLPKNATPATIAASGKNWPGYDPAGLLHDDNGDTMVVVKKAKWLRVTAGTYLISATMLQPLHHNVWGPWNERYEREYQASREKVAPFLSDDPRVRAAAFARVSLDELATILREFEEHQFGRLTAWLRHREPDDFINASVLVFRLNEADLRAALEGSAPELGPDLPMIAEQAGRQ